MPRSRSPLTRAQCREWRASARARVLGLFTSARTTCSVAMSRACCRCAKTDPTAPINVYGASKEVGETLARLAFDNLVIVRVASLFGVAGASGKGGNFVETIIRLGRERGTIRVVDDQVMSPTSTADVARFLLRMLVEGCVPGVYHVVNGGTATWFRFAKEIIHQAGIDASVLSCTSDELPTRAARPRYSALDNTKVSTRFSGLPPWEEALERYLHAKGHLK